MFYLLLIQCRDISDVVGHYVSTFHAVTRKNLTLEWHHVPRFQVHLCAPCGADFVDVVAQFVAAVFAAAQAQALVEGVSGAAAVRPALMRAVHQRVDEQVHGALVRAFHNLVHV